MLSHHLQDLNVEETGPLACLLDHIQANGVSKEDARLFATWLEKTVDGLKDARNEYKELYQDLKDEHPEQLPPQGPLYHPTKEAAQAAAEVLAADPRVMSVRMQLEPYNGWVVQVLAKPADLSDLINIADVIDGRERPGRNGKVRPIPARTAPDVAPKPRPMGDGGQGGGSAPVRGVTAQVWGIADSVLNEKGAADRAAVMALCAAAGINAATAGTQYSKWKKARGL